MTHTILPLLALCFAAIYFGLMQMPVITSRYWNMAWLLKCKEAGEKAGIPHSEQESINFTNFIREHLPQKWGLL